MKKILFLLLIAALASCSRNHLSDAYGNFESVETLISSEASGRLLDFTIEEGLEYIPGRSVGLVDSTDLHLQKIQLIRKKEAVDSKMVSVRAQIEVHEQQLENLLIDKDRLDRLFAEGAATQKQVDDLNGNLQLIRKQIEATRSQIVGIRAEMNAVDAQISQVEEAIRKCNVINPVHGTVLSKYARKGEMVAPGKPLYKIATLDTLELKVYISGGQLAYLKIGQTVEVLIDDSENSNRSLSGRVSWISSSAEFTPKTIQTKEERVRLVYAAKVRVANDGSLKIGMPGEINFMPDTSE